MGVFAAFTLSLTLGRGAGVSHGDRCLLFRGRVKLHGYKKRRELLRCEGRDEGFFNNNENHLH